jgi:hypothetical protein
VDRDEHDSLLRSLVTIAAHQITIIDDIRSTLGEMRAFNRQQVAINAEMLAQGERLERILERMIPPSPNGHQD